MNENEVVISEEEFKREVRKAAEKLITDRRKRQQKILLLLLSLLLLTIFVYAFFVPLEDNCGAFGEPKSVIGTIKAAVDTYKAKHNGDLSELAKLPNSFCEKSPLFDVLKLDELALYDHQFCEMEDFLLVIIGNENPSEYVVIYDASIGESAGKSGKGWKTGIIEYQSLNGDWLEYYPIREER